ncbi:MAG TPA: DUF3060 domain-containing protein [Croceibacterium sp.]|nr:DUF3060 domain-containing protein [Croceibacterium sp.]
MRAWIIAAALAVVSAPLAAQASFTGAGETSQLDCDGGEATIEGASNTLAVTGGCTRVVITGAGNTITVALAPKGAIEVTGASNTIRWTTPDGSAARVSVTGAGNRIEKAR